MVSNRSNNSSVSGLDTLSYLNSKELSQVLFVKSKRAPTINDKKFRIATLWLDETSNTVYSLVNVSSTATWVVLSAGSGDLDTLTGNTGGAVGPGTGNINVVGSSGITVSGDPVTHTLTISGASSSGSTLSVQTFTTSGTYTPTPGMAYAILEVVGGGGGGGFATSGANEAIGAAGGGAGGYARKLVAAATIGASQTVTVGTGGTGGILGSINGKIGTDTSIGTIVSATGGFGGVGTSAVSSPSGAGGGMGINGDINCTGGSGGTGFGTNAATYISLGGYGGNSVFGGGAKGDSISLVSMVSTSHPGNNGSNYGGGGSGAVVSDTGSAANGGNGADGVVIITEFS